MIISPSILSANFANLEQDIKKVTDAGATWIHIDVMDGHFVPNITIGAPVVKDIRKITNAKLDVHLMIENPEKYVDDFINAGADIITFHQEAKVVSRSLINYIKSKNKMVGISIKPTTFVGSIAEFIPMVDMVLIMTVEPGFSGQEFMFDAAEKIKIVSDIAKKQNPNLIIQVDGGINEKTAKICKDFGANCLVAGNYIYKNENIKEAVQTLLNI
ncbi:MAG: ribulose-phosphate 3-epimerase [Cyanobacteria bacterium SIG30]|nr:ribulose-phosphate 3-epimerase [Cyanobacteria bacterium SIG30]